jgi:hypothetical protein
MTASLQARAPNLLNVYIQICRLATDPEVPGSIPGHYKKEKNSGSGTGPTQPREYN